MKVWFVLSAVCAGVISCDVAPKNAVANNEEIVAATPAPQQRPGDWMWDKEKRGNPLEAGTHSKRYR